MSLTLVSLYELSADQILPITPRKVMEEPNMGSKAQVPPLPEQTCKRFFRDLLLGLEYCASLFV